MFDREVERHGTENSIRIIKSHAPQNQHGAIVAQKFPVVVHSRVKAAAELKPVLPRSQNSSKAARSATTAVAPGFRVNYSYCCVLVYVCHYTAALLLEQSRCLSWELDI